MDFLNFIVYGNKRDYDGSHKSTKPNHSIVQDGNASRNTAENNKHIRANNRFLQMFEGSKQGSLLIANKKVTQDKEELQKIRETIRTAPRVGEVISIAYLKFSTTYEVSITDPVLLQIVYQTVKVSEIRSLSLTITAENASQVVQLREY